MKIAYIDVELSGHHMSYLRELVKNNEDSILIVPQKIDEFTNKQYILESNMLHKHPIKYLKWIYNVEKILQKESIDVVHFVYGDVFYRYFGTGISRIKNRKILVTFHQIRRGKLRDKSIKRIFKIIDIGVVHTKSLIKDLNELNIKNIEHIEYPQFNDLSKFNKEEACRLLNLPKNKPIIACIGFTSHYKGLDILLASLNKIDEPFHLLIAGREDTFGKEYINEHSVKYKNKVTTILKFLTQEELEQCLVASDIIALPYRKSFDGASGPLGEGAWLRKTIVGPNHGSLGDIIETNNLGITFETEDVDDLANAIKRAIKGEFKWSSDSEKYRKQLDPQIFINKYKIIYENLYKKISKVDYI